MSKQWLILFLSLILVVLSYPSLLSTLAAFSPRALEDSLSTSQILSKHVPHLVMKTEREREREGWGRASLLLTRGYIRHASSRSSVSLWAHCYSNWNERFSFSMQDHNHRGALLAWCLVFLVFVQQVNLKNSFVHRSVNCWLLICYCVHLGTFLIF